MLLKRFIAVMLLVTGMMIPVARAVETCSTDYYAFISTVRSENTRADYFKDFFTLSTCQVNDVLELYDELDAVRDQFRGAASNCEETTSYKEDYHRILMEVYFIRNVQKRDPGVTREEDVKRINQTKDVILDDLEKKMRQVFVLDEERVGETTFETYFGVWKEKYYDVIGEYARCEEGAWAELTETWHDFVDTMKSLKIDAPDTSNVTPFKDRFSGTVPSKEELAEAIVAPFRDTIGSWKVVKEDQEMVTQEVLGPNPTFGDAIAEAFSIEGVLDALVEQQEGYDVSKNGIHRMQKYAMLYGQGGAQITTSLQGIVNNIIDIIDSMSNTDLPQMKEKLKKVSDKQCN